LEQPLWLASAVPPLALLWWRMRRRAALPVAVASAEELPRSWRLRAGPLPGVAVALAFLAMATALARPVQRLPLPPERLGVDLMVCLDASSSMRENDLGEGRDRFAAAKAFAQAFGSARAEDRIGAVVFARFADLVCPPTLDRAAFAQLLDGVTMIEQDGDEDATGFGAAIARAAEVLARAKTAHKAIVLVSDGEENVASVAAPQEIAPLHAAQWCKGLGVRVHTVAVGKGRALPDGSFAPLDTTALREVAAASGGKHFVAADAVALAAVQSAIATAEQSAFAEPKTLVREWFAAAAACSWLLFWLAALARRLGLGVAT
jgi:Mg-chelatase subunit ChlD